MCAVCRFVPLTITLKKAVRFPVNRLLNFGGVGGGRGSLLTPVGNPQDTVVGRSGLTFAG